MVLLYSLLHKLILCLSLIFGHLDEIRHEVLASYAPLENDLLKVHNGAIKWGLGWGWWRWLAGLET